MGEEVDVRLRADVVEVRFHDTLVATMPSARIGAREDRLPARDLVARLQARRVRALSLPGRAVSDARVQAGLRRARRVARRPRGRRVRADRAPGGEHHAGHGGARAGKTHTACAIGDALVRAGRSVLFTPAFQLVQDPLAVKRDLALPSALRKLDAYELIVLDDIGYIKQRPDVVEVLFTLLAERYERRSLRTSDKVGAK
jgi:DNA replication protein DnaC